MINWIKQFLLVQSQDANAKAIAKHLSRVLLYELKKEKALYPELKEKFLQLQKIMNDKGKPIWLVDSFRSVPTQNSLSPNVTNAKGLESYHQYGLAFDVAFVGKNWDVLRFWWDELGQEGTKIGLTWGGTWGDYGHFEWHPLFTWKELRDYFIME